MMRNLIVLGCAGLLALGLSVSSFAGSTLDTDGDGSTDVFDNCEVVANGALGSTASCDSQEDGDQDGYGNTCDTDTDQDGATGLADVSDTLARQKVGSTDPNYDFDCDGATGLADVSRALADQKVGTIPGPSGYHCANLIGNICP